MSYGENMDVLTSAPAQGRNGAAPDRATAPYAAGRTFADVQPEVIHWLWPGRFPAGKLVMLDGDPSVGKSTLAITFAAHVSAGRPWPDGATCPRGDVVILSAEDGLADTMHPRLTAAGGDHAHVHTMDDIVQPGDDGDLVRRHPSLNDTDALREYVHRRQARLVVVDVLMAYLPSGVDSHRDQDVRTILSRLSRLAEDTGATVLLLRHLNKGGNGSAALYRGGGSIGIIGAARAGYLVARDPEDDQVRVIACVKSNLAPEPPSLSYRLESAPNGHARVVWCGESSHNAGALLTTVSTEEQTENTEATEWLLSYLHDQGGSARAADVIRKAKADGIAERTLKRARTRAGVDSTRRGFGQGSVWSVDP